MPNEVVDRALPTMYSGAFIFFLGFLVTRCVDWAIAYFKQPKPRVTFSERNDVVAVTAHQRVSSLTELPKQVPVSQMWVRVAVRNSNRQPATGCRAYLVGVDEMDAAGQFRRTQYNDSLPLNWSFEQQAAESVALPKGVTRHFDLVVISAGQLGFNVRLRDSDGNQLVPTPYLPIFQSPHGLRFKVAVCGDNFDPAFQTVTIQWAGTWPPTFPKV